MPSVRGVWQYFSSEETKRAMMIGMTSTCQSLMIYTTSIYRKQQVTNNVAKRFSELRAKMSPEALEKAAGLSQAMLDEMPLQELRRARALSQEQLARTLGVKQASVSKLERRTDMYIQTLRNYIEAVGGQLEITAKFPDGKVKINQFEEVR